MNYNQEYVTRKATTNVAGTGANYRIEYIVLNPKDAAIDSITATIFQVITEGEGEAAKEKLTEIGSGSINMGRNRTYFSIEKYDSVTLDNQAAIAAQFFADLKSILAE